MSDEDDDWGDFSAFAEDGDDAGNAADGGNDDGDEFGDFAAFEEEEVTDAFADATASAAPQETSALKAAAGSASLANGALPAPKDTGAVKDQANGTANAVDSAPAQPEADDEDWGDFSDDAFEDEDAADTSAGSPPKQTAKDTTNGSGSSAVVLSAAATKQLSSLPAGSMDLKDAQRALQDEQEKGDVAVVDEEVEEEEDNDDGDDELVQQAIAMSLSTEDETTTGAELGDSTAAPAATPSQDDAASLEAATPDNAEVNQVVPPTDTGVDMFGFDLPVEEAHDDDDPFAHITLDHSAVLEEKLDDATPADLSAPKDTQTTEDVASTEEVPGNTSADAAAQGDDEQADTYVPDPSLVDANVEDYDAASTSAAAAPVATSSASDENVDKPDTVTQTKDDDVASPASSAPLGDEEQGVSEDSHTDAGADASSGAAVAIGSDVQGADVAETDNSDLKTDGKDADDDTSSTEPTASEQSQVTAVDVTEPQLAHDEQDSAASSGAVNDQQPSGGAVRDDTEDDPVAEESADAVEEPATAIDSKLSPRSQSGDDAKDTDMSVPVGDAEDASGGVGGSITTPVAVDEEADTMDAAATDASDDAPADTAVSQVASDDVSADAAVSQVASDDVQDEAAPLADVVDLTEDAPSPIVEDEKTKDADVTSDALATGATDDDDTGDAAVAAVDSPDKEEDDAQDAAVVDTQPTISSSTEAVTSATDTTADDAVPAEDEKTETAAADNEPLVAEADDAVDSSAAADSTDSPDAAPDASSAPADEDEFAGFDEPSAAASAGDEADDLSAEDTVKVGADDEEDAFGGFDDGDEWGDAEPADAPADTQTADVDTTDATDTAAPVASADQPSTDSAAAAAKEADDDEWGDEEEWGAAAAPDKDTQEDAAVGGDDAGFGDDDDWGDFDDDGDDGATGDSGAKDADGAQATPAGDAEDDDWGGFDEEEDAGADAVAADTTAAAASAPSPAAAAAPAPVAAPAAGGFSSLTGLPLHEVDALISQVMKGALTPSSIAVSLDESKLATLPLALARDMKREELLRQAAARPVEFQWAHSALHKHINAQLNLEMEPLAPTPPPPIRSYSTTSLSSAGSSRVLQRMSSVDAIALDSKEPNSVAMRASSPLPSASPMSASSPNASPSVTKQKRSVWEANGDVALVPLGPEDDSGANADDDIFGLRTLNAAAATSSSSSSANASSSGGATLNSGFDLFSLDIGDQLSAFATPDDAEEDPTAGVASHKHPNESMVDFDFFAAPAARQDAASSENKSSSAASPSGSRSPVHRSATLTSLSSVVEVHVVDGNNIKSAKEARRLLQETMDELPDLTFMVAAQLQPRAKA